MNFTNLSAVIPQKMCEVCTTQQAFKDSLKSLCQHSSVILPFIFICSAVILDLIEDRIKYQYLKGNNKLLFSGFIIQNMVFFKVDFKELTLFIGTAKLILLITSAIILILGVKIWTG
jgi:hypothetical protein